MNILKIQPNIETKKIVTFMQKTLKRENIRHVVIGVSGGIDSTTSLFLLANAFPKEHIFPVHLYFFTPQKKTIEMITKKAGIPKENLTFLSIKNPVHTFQLSLHVSIEEKIRLGNIMARTRMIMLYDLAKKYRALVCGTENKSEYFLGYFTRFGDEASDIEPLRHLYKAQVYQLAKFLNVPKEIITQEPSAGLWHGQTDEEEFGFSYKDADQVLYLYFEKNKSVDEIGKMGFENAEKIIDWTKLVDFKHHTPYILSS